MNNILASNELNEIYLELSNKFDTKKGKSLNLFCEMFFHIRFMKYATQDNIKKINPNYKNTASATDLKILCELGYLKEVSKMVFIATNKVLPVLKEKFKLDINVIPKESTGYGSINELNNATVFSDIMSYDKLLINNFLLFPSFPPANPYIKPDGLLLIKREGKYSLNFLEIEHDKPKWKDYVLDKKFVYFRLSKDPIVYNYWASKLQNFGFPPIGINEFCFRVVFVSELNFNFGNGFIFVNNIKEVLNG